MVAIIKLSYRQIIDAFSEGAFAQSIFNASYAEYLLKSQAYNAEGKFKTFSELKAADGRANSLHYKAGFAVGGFISLLNNQVPFLQDAAGKTILFDTFRFEVLESDVTNKSAHKVAIHYITDTMTLLNSFGENLLLVYGDKSSELSVNPKQVIEDTFLMKLNSDVSITSYLQL